MNPDVVTDLLRVTRDQADEAVRHRVGVVTAVSPLSVDLGNSGVAYTSVKALASYVPVVGDVVSVLRFGQDVLVAGLIGGSSVPEVAALPGSPYDGQVVDLLVDSAGTYGGPFLWRCKYRAATAGSFKWHVLGGAPLTSEIATAESTASLTYVDLATPGPSITLPFAGDWLLGIGADMYNSVGAGAQVATVKLGAAGASDADAVIEAAAAIFQELYGWRSMRRAGLAAGAVMKMQYRVSAGTGNFQRRNLEAHPLRIG